MATPLVIQPDYFKEIYQYFAQMAHDTVEEETQKIQKDPTLTSEEKEKRIELLKEEYKVRPMDEKLSELNDLLPLLIPVKEEDKVDWLKPVDTVSENLDLLLDERRDPAIQYTTDLFERLNLKI